MRKRTNKLLAVLLTGAMAMSMGAWGNGGASTDNTQKKGSDDQVTIKITWWGGDARHEATQKVLDLYTESHPNVKFEAIPAGWDGYFEKLSTQAASGSMPDIVQMDYLYISTYAKNNSLADLSEYVDSGVIDTSTIDKNIMKTGDSNGKTVGIPLSTTALAVTYNPTVIEQAGAEVPSDDWTWDDMADIAKQLTRSDGSVYGISAEYETQIAIYNTIFANGGTIVSEDKKTSGYDTEATQAGVQCWVDMMKDGVSPSEASLEETKGNVQFLSGRLGMYWCGSWFLSQVLDSDIKDDIDVAPVPSINGKQATVIHGLGNCIYKDTKNPEAAWKWVEFL